MNHKCAFCGQRTYHREFRYLRQKIQCRTCFELMGMPHSHKDYASTRYCERLEEEWCRSVWIVVSSTTLPVKQKTVSGASANGCYLRRRPRRLDNWSSNPPISSVFIDLKFFEMMNKCIHYTQLTQRVRSCRPPVTVKKIESGSCARWMIRRLGKRGAGNNFKPPR